jgi:hypothetical protein
MQRSRRDVFDERDKARRLIAHRCDRIKSVLRDEPHVRLAVLRVGFAALGLDRFRDFHLSYPHRARLDDTSIVIKLGAAIAEDSPQWYQRYWNVFDDLISCVDWQKGFRLLQQNADELVDAVAGLLSQDRAFKKLGAHEAWVWAASSLGVGDDGIGRKLDGLIASTTTQLGELSNLSKARRACSFSSHVFLVSSIVHDYFLQDLTSLNRIREQLINAFGSRRDELNAELAEQVESCRAVSADMVACANEKLSLAGGITAASLARAFMGFYVGKCDLEVVNLLAVRKRTYRSAGEENRRSGPRTLDYAHCALSSTTPWDNVSPGAALLRAQGSTRSPKGHRA